jgi:hypothetical protein
MIRFAATFLVLLQRTTGVVFFDPSEPVSMRKDVRVDAVMLFAERFVKERLRRQRAERRAEAERLRADQAEQREYEERVKRQVTEDQLAYEREQTRCPDCLRRRYE